MGSNGVTCPDNRDGLVEADDKDLLFCGRMKRRIVGIRMSVGVVPEKSSKSTTLVLPLLIFSFLALL